MTLIDILLISVALSMDACVVSFLYGIKQKEYCVKSALSLALFTGIFQMLMPYISGICTCCVKCYIEPYSKWIIFFIFMYLGINFIKESFDKAKEVKPLTFTVLLMIAIATSIDALSVGIPLSLKLQSIIIPVIIIGVITFINSILGFVCGRFLGKLNTKYLEISGGIILIILALKVVL